MPIDFNKCVYLNAEKDNADSMLKKCINGSDELAWPCVSKEDIDKDIYGIVTERASGDIYPANTLDTHEKVVGDTGDAGLYGNSNVEGFTNMGERYVRPGECPDGYYWCNASKRCKQVCMNCKYNQRTYGKSKEFNEADPCFPNQGVYNGITNMGILSVHAGQEVNIAMISLMLKEVCLLIMYSL